MQFGFSPPVSGPLSSPDNLARIAVEGEAIGYDYATMKMPESVGEQAKNALATIEKALNQAGADIKDVVDRKSVV